MAPGKASSSSASNGSAFDLPKLRVSFGFEADTRYLKSHEDSVAEFFDVKFCPYQPLNQSPVFAAVSKKHVVICRLSQEKEDSSVCEVINIIRDNDDSALNCCCTWSKDVETGRPLLCVAGKDSKVKVYDVTQNKVAQCLVGHGREINDLATSPSDPAIIASASDDTTVRIWSLDPVHRKQPCLCLLGGEGHCAGLLSVAFHDTGRYLLSAGHDGIINLWTLPDLPTEPMRDPYELHYSHFSTSEIHSALVDCVAFYGDKILSRACHDEVIVLWSIEGFTSKDPPPPQSTAPTTYDPSRLTRSAFSTPSPVGPVLYTRLLQFQTPGCGPQFFMRFRLHFVPGQHHVLAFCNAGGKIFFWDFERFQAYLNFVEAYQKAQATGQAPPQRPPWLQLTYTRKTNAADSLSRIKDTSDMESVETGSASASASAGASVPPTAVAKMEEDVKQTGMLKDFSKDTINTWESKYNMDSPHRHLKPHKAEAFGMPSFVGRQVGWSPNGQWCVVVGSANFALVLQRWAKK